MSSFILVLSLRCITSRLFLENWRFCTCGPSFLQRDSSSKSVLVESLARPHYVPAQMAKIHQVPPVPERHEPVVIPELLLRGMCVSGGASRSVPGFTISHFTTMLLDYYTILNYAKQSKFCILYYIQFYYVISYDYYTTLYVFYILYNIILCYILMYHTFLCAS